MTSVEFKVEKAAIMPAGSFGTALAVPLSRNASRVVLYFRSQQQADSFNRIHQNQLRFPGVQLPDNIYATSDPKEALDGAEIVVLVPPARFMRDFYNTNVKPFLNRHALVTCGSKGFEEETHLRMLQVLVQEDPTIAKRGAVFSGPNFAREIVRGKPTATVIASKNKSVAEELVSVFNTDTFRPYPSDDVIGVELGGILKNPIAMAVGICDGMDFGSNAHAALMNRGLKEMTRLAVVLGADERTLSGLSGEADLTLSCQSPGRNYLAGVDIGRGVTPKSLMDSGITIEGLFSVKSAVELARKNNVEIPIMQVLYEILYEGVSLYEAAGRLMKRDLSYEDPLPVTGIKSRFCIRVLNRLLHLWHRRVRVAS